MGCDIYMHSQVKNEKGKWVWYDKNIFDDRSYILFGILCGCRDDTFQPIADWKGYPKDSEDKLKDNEPNGWDYDYVTEGGVYLGYAGVSYLSLTELKSFDWNQEIPGRPEYPRPNQWYFYTNVMAYLEACADKFGGPDNVRIVFGFSV